jgi:hypothetical protein
LSDLKDKVNLDPFESINYMITPSEKHIKELLLYSFDRNTKQVDQDIIPNIPKILN